MKLRIKGNTIRMRLTRPEVAYFEKFGMIEDKTEFGNSSLVYALEISKGDTLTADFASGRISFFLPEKIADEWTKTSLVSVNGEMHVSENKKLFILLEKDFKCLDETTEDQSDNYENPLAHLHK
jgi:hypothetical protein